MYIYLMPRLMTLAEKYRLGAVISIVLLLLTLVILFITIWNKVSLHPEAGISNSIYFLLILIGISGISMFVLFLWYANTINIKENLAAPVTKVQENKTREEKTEGFAAPFEVDIDALTDKILTNIKPSLTIEDYTEKILINFAQEFEITQGIFYLINEKTKLYEPASVYAYSSEKKPEPFALGEGLNGQTAKSKQILSIENLPNNYLNVVSGLGQHKANHLIIIPLLLNKETIGIIELTTFHSLDEEKLWIFKNLAKIIGNALINKSRREKG